MADRGKYCYDQGARHVFILNRERRFSVPTKASVCCGEIACVDGNTGVAMCSHLVASTLGPNLCTLFGAALEGNKRCRWCLDAEAAATDVQLIDHMTGRTL